MGFLAWVRRVGSLAGQRVGTLSATGTAGPGPAAGAAGRPLAGLLGGPQRSAPSQQPADDVPTPLSRTRLTDWFTEHAYTFFVDSDGDVGGLWRGRLFYFFCFGERSEILQVRGQWNREFSIERLTEVLEICNLWNSERLWPKAYVRVRDDGMVHVTCEVATDLEHGVTDDQLGQLVQCGLSSASVFFDELDELYPDPAAEAP
ncbi:hypothetical protein N866_01205 [Actinotalea ferrariae CF5-4]|uniref:Sensory transduction regulator n=1 Tax=Actinotalea ferrariae CF5-4 TaxID=948458 RepID=A0A021VWB2_9CELL|nr:YbjN domain-containing protein [Actinotalea ferrariae]EYR63342.1 hypothetical protein N866_01205 [Actinotalea ferrariae CF5-4]